MDGPKLRVLSPGNPINPYLDVGSVEEDEEAGEGWACLEDRLAQDTFIFGILSGPVGTKLGNGWILPSSSLPEQPYSQGRPRDFDLDRKQMESIQLVP